MMIAPIGLPEEAQVLAKLTKIGSRFEREDIATRAPAADRAQVAAAVPHSRHR